jgi:hypothetical protein
MSAVLVEVRALPAGASAEQPETEIYLGIPRKGIPKVISEPNSHPHHATPNQAAVIAGYSLL